MKMATTAIPEANLPQPDEGETHFDMLRRWMPMKMVTTTIPEANLPQPADGETHFDMLKRWTKGEMTDYEEIELVNSLTQQQIIKGGLK